VPGAGGEAVFTTEGEIDGKEVCGSRAGTIPSSRPSPRHRELHRRVPSWPNWLTRISGKFRLIFLGGVRLLQQCAHQVPHGWMCPPRFIESRGRSPAPKISAIALLRPGRSGHYSPPYGPRRSVVGDITGGGGPHTGGHTILKKTRGHRCTSRLARTAAGSKERGGWRVSREGRVAEPDPASAGWQGPSADGGFELWCRRYFLYAAQPKQRPRKRG